MTGGPDDKNIEDQDLNLQDDQAGMDDDLLATEDVTDDSEDVDTGEDEGEDGDEESPGLRGASELDSLHEELQKYDESESELESQSSKSSRSDSADRGQQDLTPEYLLTDEIKIRAQRDHGKIRVYLSGKVLFVLEDLRQSYIFDWSSEKLTTGLVTGSDADPSGADCVITLTEDTLMRAAYGDLNPQVGMLSDKIKVSGKLGFAVYIFNLIAPKNFLH